MKKIFVIDDDKMYRMLLNRLFVKINTGDIQVEFFGNGEEALNSLKQMQLANESLPSIVFLDINMPILDGWQFLEGLDEIKPKISNNLNIYMISSSLDGNDRLKAISNKYIKDFLTKPLSLETIQNIVNNN